MNNNHSENSLRGSSFLMADRYCWHFCYGADGLILLMKALMLPKA
jgi:hypothetical protein